MNDFAELFGDEISELKTKTKVRILTILLIYFI